MTDSAPLVSGTGHQESAKGSQRESNTFATLAFGEAPFLGSELFEVRRQSLGIEEHAFRASRPFPLKTPCLAEKMLCQWILVTNVNETTPNAPVAPPAGGLQVLILEPDKNVSAEIVSALEEAAPGARAAVAQSLGEVQDLVHDQKPALFVLDVDATHDLAQEFIYDLRTSHPNARAIILTAFHFPAQREQVAALGAIHFFEKPFPRADFVTLVGALLASGSKTQADRFQGTLSDLHIADIIQLKCISGSTSMLEFSGPKGEKARLYFENGQIRHAVTPDKQGLAAFNAIVDWKGGTISEIAVPPGTPHTINLEWQVVLMDAVRRVDEIRVLADKETAAGNSPATSPKVLVIDDSMMLLDFVKEVLCDEGYEVATAPNAIQGLRLCHDLVPDMVLLDFLLPDMKGDEVCSHLMADPATAAIPVVFVSGFGNDLAPDQVQIPNVKGLLSKPFGSQMLLNTVQSYLPKKIPLPNEFCFPVPGNEPETPSPPSFVISQTPTTTEAVNPVASTESTDADGPPPGEQSFTPHASRTTPAVETHSSVQDNNTYPAAEATAPALTEPALLAERLEAPPTEFSVADPMQRAGEIASQIAPAETSHTNGSRRELPFTDRVSEDNSPGSFDATGLPATLAVDTSTGLISGMPSAVGTFSVILKATNAGGTGTATLTLTINPPPPTITSPLSATAKAGQPFTYQITGTNSPSSYGVTGLPAGVAADTSIGLISGTPSAVGTFSVILSATNAGGTGTATLTLAINPPPPTITSPLSATAKAGQPFAYKITGANSPSSYEAIGLPAGLTVNTITGEINGKPSLTGTFLVNLYATNGGGTGRAELSIDVIPPPPVITSPLSATATAGQQFVYQIVASSDSSGGGV